MRSSSSPLPTVSAASTRIHVETHAHHRPDTLESISALVDVFAADLSCEIGSIANTTYSTSFGAGDNTLEDPPPPSVIIPVESEQTDFIIATRECPQLYISVRHPSLSALNGSFCRGDASGEDAARFVLIWGEWEDVIVPSRSETPSPTFLTFSPRTVVKRDPQFLTILPVETASPTTRAATLPQSTGNVESTREPPTTQPTSTPGFVPSERVFTPSLALVCKPSYSVRKGTVTLRKNANGAVAQSVAFDERDRPSAIPSVTSWDILREFARTIAETSRSLPTLNLQGFLSTSMSQQSPAADPEATMSELARLFRLITAQYANIYLKTAVQMPLLGNSTSQQARLTVDPLSFWLMEASLVFLVLLVGYLYRKSPAMSVAPGDPSTVAGLATILAQSKGTLSKLEGTGHVGIHELHRILQHDTFKTSTSMSSSAAGEGYVTHPSFQIETATSAPAMRDSESKMSSGHDAARTPQLASSVKWHEPFAVTLAGRVLVLAAIVALITTVELLYQRSARNNGLIAIPDPGNVLAHAAWTYVPTAVMVALSLALAALSTEAKLLSPYQQLRRNHGRPRLSRVANAAADPLTRNYLPSLSVVALYRAVRGGDYAVALASLAAMLAPMLAIAAGGLYSVVAVPTTAPVRVLMLDAVVFNATDAADAGLVNAHLVLANNLSDPLWTSGEFALPRLSIVDSEDGVQRRGGDAPIPPGGLLDVVLPASRARLNCTPATPAQVNCGGDSVTGEAYTGRIGGVRIEESREFSGDGPTSGGTGWFGQVYDLTMVANQTAYLNGSQPWECPQVMVAVGHQTAHFIDQVSHLACKPFIEETRVRARFRLPSWELDSPPVAVEDGNARTTVVVWDGASPDFITNSRLFASPLAHNVSDEDLTSFFPLVVYGPDGVPIRELVAAPVDDPDSVFARAVDRTYALIMAQVLNHQRREVTRGGFAAGTETPEAARVFDGTLTGGAGRTEMRLLQNKVVTRVLEALLAAILACALMACVSLRSASGVLPKNPCSVAAVASLLEGSALLRQTLSLTHEVPDGDRSSHWPASWQTAAGREKWSRLGPYCGMGWWDEDGRPVELGTAARGAVRPRRSGLAVRFGIDLHDPKGEDRGMSRQHQDVSVSGWPLLGRDWRPKKS